MRRLIVTVVAVVIVIGINLLIAECVLQLLPVDSGRRTLPVTAQDPVYRFTPNKPFTYSRDWDFRLVNTGRVNNAGFVNDADYDQHATSPLLAIVGDSYVEALMVPFGSSISGRLAAAAASQGRVYSFAASGAPLSQYLVWADHARRTYRPNALVVVVIGNDFDESLLVYKNAPGLHYFVPDASGRLELQRVDYVPSTMRQILTHSALVRYLYLNLQIPWRIEAITSSAWAYLTGVVTPTVHYVANTSADTDAERVTRSRAAVDAFLDRLPTASGLRPEHVLLVVNGLQDPSQIGDAAVSTSYFATMRTYLIDNARARGFEVADMAPIFAAHYAAGGVRIDNWPDDEHWSALGHRLVADAVLRSKVFTSTFGAAPRDQRSESPLRSSRPLASWTGRSPNVVTKAIMGP